MKKVLNLLFIFAFIFVLSSCGFKKEIEAPEIDGDKMSKNKVESFYKDYEQYIDKIENGDKTRAISKGWYSVSSNLRLVSSYEDGDKWRNATIKAKISGDMYDSNYSYDKMMHLTIHFEIESDGNEKEDTKNVKGKYEIFVKEGMSWIKGSYCLDNEEEKKDSKIYMKGTLDELMKQIPLNIRIILDIKTTSTADMHQFGCSFVEQLKNYDEETTSVYESDDKYTIKKDENTNFSADSGEVKTKSIVEVEFEDKENFVAKEFSAYSDIETNGSNADTNITYEISIKKKIMGIIIPPIFEGKYQNYGDSEIFPDIA